MMTFQSRFGRGKWLEPATNRTVRKLAKDGVKNLAVITPGFSADCLETLEEVAIENGRLFKKYGGENFAALPCLNDSAPGMLVIWQMALRELKGWGGARRGAPPHVGAAQDQRRLYPGLFLCPPATERLARGRS